MSDLELTIRERAYQLWQEDGQQDGRAEAHWLQAQREILAASLASIARVPKSKAEKATTPGPRKKRRVA
jgi:hypothetical protein